MKMENSIKKRVRSSNWEESEKRLLTQLITERIDIIENKDTSTSTNILKKAAWQEILMCFNSFSTRKRDISQIMTQWRNTKGKVKAEHKRAKLLTGGVSPSPSPPPEDIIVQASPDEFMVDTNILDTDSVYTNQFVGDSSQHQSELEDVFATQWSGHTPDRNQLKQIKLHKNKAKSMDEYKKQLFLIIKQSKERDDERAEEIHKKRLKIMDLEEEYWQKKIDTLK